MPFKSIFFIAILLISGYIFAETTNSTEHNCCIAKEWQEWTFEHNGCNIYVRERGFGIPVIVINRLGFDHSYLMDALCPGPEFTRFVFYDPSIALRSNCVKELNAELSLHMLAEEIESLRKHLNSEYIVLISHSSGSLLAYEYMQNYPGHVKGLIAFAPWPAAGFAEHVLHQTEIRKHEIKRMHNRFIHGTAQKMFGNMPPPLSFKRLLEFSAINLHDPEKHWEKIRGYYEFNEKAENKIVLDRNHWDYMPVIVSADSPVLFLYGKEDYIQPSWEGLIIDYLNHVRFEEFKDTGHLPWIENPALVNRWLKPYIDMFISY